MDEAIAIKFLKRFITDNANRPKIEPVAVSRKEKIAVVGGGPSGLTAARDLALRGYKVTVFEELPKAGGMLYWGIPSYRLPRNILDGEIDDIRGLGVEIKLNTRVGKDITFAKLEKDFDYIYLATGAHKSQKMGVTGEDLKNVFTKFESYGEKLKLIKSKIPNMVIFDRETVFLNITDKVDKKNNEADVIFRNKDYAETMAAMFERTWDKSYTLKEYFN